MAEQQTYANHVRFFPLFHFVVVPLLVLNFLSHLVRFFMDPSWGMGFWTLLSVTLILMALAARLMAMTVQDRVIRLEEKASFSKVAYARYSRKGV